MQSSLPSVTTTIQNGVASVPTPVQNGTSEVGKHEAASTEAPIANGIVHQPVPMEKHSDSVIEEGKQKAKAVLAAASGVAPQPSPSTDVTVKQDPSAKIHAAHMNGSAPSRKRSRSGTRLPQISPYVAEPVPLRSREELEKRAQALKIEQYVSQEMVHSAALDTGRRWHESMIQEKLKEVEWYKHPERQHERRVNPSAFFGHGYAGYGNGNTDLAPRAARIVYPGQRKRPGGRKTKELQVLRKDRASQAEQIDELVPIRLDIEYEKVRLRDTFTWNIHDRVIPIDLFAEKLVEDFNLPLESYRPLIQQVAANVQEQIQEFHPHVFIDEEALDPHLPYHAYKNDEMRITIKLNITIGQHTLVDQFEWEINNPMNNPEDFARQMTRDLSLSGEFTTAIAHSIREQSQLFTRSLYVTNHPFDGRPVEDQELKSSFLPSPLSSPFRPYQAAKEFTPYLYEVNEIALEKTELSLSREERRQKRSVNRRGGPTLPDLKDRRQTIRTLIVSTVLPGSAERIEDSRIYKRAAAVSGKSRRPGMGQRDGMDDSDDSDSEGSSPDSPAVQAHLLAGTARTRGMRGAASVAQAAMRATVGRSATPESSTLHHHETRTSGRRTNGREYREESSVDPPTTLIIKLRIPRQRFQQFLRDQRARSKEESLQPQPTNNRPSSQRHTSGNSVGASPLAASMGPPSTTPRMQPQNLPATTNGTSSHQRHDTTDHASEQQPSAMQSGRVDAEGPPGPDHPIVCLSLSFFFPKFLFSFSAYPLWSSSFCYLTDYNFLQDRLTVFSFSSTVLRLSLVALDRTRLRRA